MKKLGKVIITAALSGGATRKENNPGVPYTPEEFAEESYRCMQEGVSIIHIHAKDLKSGYGTVDVKATEDVCRAIKKRCPDVILNISTGSMTDTPEDRIKPIEAVKPELCSFNTNSMNFGFINYRTGDLMMEFVYRNTYADQIFWADKLAALPTKPEFEIFDQGGLNNVLLLNKKAGRFRQPMHFQFVYGVAGGMAFEPLLHMSLVNTLPEGSTYSVCGVGPHQVPAAFYTMIQGGHVRIGLEDNVKLPDKTLSKGSWDQAIWVRDLARIAGREVATPAEARDLLHLGSA